MKWLQTPRSEDSDAVLRYLGPLHPLPSCWEHELLTAHSCIPHCALPWATGNYFTRGYPPSRGQLTMTDWCRTTKVCFHGFNLGQLWVAVSVPELPIGLAETSVTITLWVSFSLCPIPLPHFPTGVPPKSTPQKNPHATLHLSLFPRQPIYSSRTVP